MPASATLRWVMPQKLAYRYDSSRFLRSTHLASQLARRINPCFPKSIFNGIIS